MADEVAPARTELALIPCHSITPNRTKRHDLLPPELEKRAMVLYERLGWKLVQKGPEAWLDGFLFDADPHREIEIWEAIADVTEWASRRWPTKSRRTLFRLVIAASVHAVDPAPSDQAIIIRAEYHDRLGQSGLQPEDDGGLEMEQETETTPPPAEQHPVGRLTLADGQHRAAGLGALAVGRSDA